MKKFSLVLALAAIAISANAQLLWKISGNGIQKPSYIFGTHHVAPATMIDSVKGASEALAGAENVYGEIDMSVMNDMGAMMKMQQATMAPADSTLSKVFSADELKKNRRHAYRGRRSCNHRHARTRQTGHSFQSDCSWPC